LRLTSLSVCDFDADMRRAVLTASPRVDQIACTSYSRSIDAPQVGIER